MPVSHIRGYAITESWAFLNERYDVDTVKRITSEVPASERAVVLSFKSAGWYPIEHANHVWSAIAKAKSERDDVLKEIVACGEHCAYRASGTFMRLLMRVMSPKMLARKFPDIWAHDFRGGIFSATIVDEKHFVAELSDVAAVSHIGPIAVGFVSFVMKAVGKSDVKSTLTEWSPENPAPEKMQLEFDWS